MKVLSNKLPDQLLSPNGPRSMDQRRGLLFLIPTAEPQDLGPGTPRLGPQAFSAGLVSQLGWSVVLAADAIII